MYAKDSYYTNNEITDFIKKVSNKKESKAIEQNKFDILSTLILSNLTSKDNVIGYINDYYANNIIKNIDVLETGGTFDINPKYKKFANILYKRRSVGIGTPNAASGAGELFLLFCSPLISISKKKGEGDLILNNSVKIEIKGDEGIRTPNSPITGKQLKLNCDKICEKYGYKPNKSTIKNYDYAVEPWGFGYKEKHWVNEFKNHSLSENINFLYDIVNNGINLNIKKGIERCFNNNVFDPRQFRIEIVKGLWSYGINETKWDYFVSIDDNLKVFSIGHNITDFNNKIDNNLIKIESDYFRINQNIGIGWYIGFNYDK